MERIIDLRSDTVTKPTDDMRIAMAIADVGDDVFGDDRTVENLQKQVASLLGKEAALFVPSGTMGNLICCMIHCREKGSEMIVGSDSHIHLNEGGGTASLGGIHSRVVQNEEDGTMDLKKVEGSIRNLGDDHHPVTRLVCIENTHNRCGGRVISERYMNDLGALCKKHNLKLHLDGARIMNASVYLGIPPSRLTAAADSVNMCLSKGLAAPVGSIVAGSHSFIQLARKYRKALGGGMRQVGVLAAAGLISVNRMISRLSEDHRNAKRLASGLNAIPGFSCDESKVQTNILFVSFDPKLTSVDASTLLAKLKEKGILIAASPTSTSIRFVTHYQITANDVDFVVNEMNRICKLNSRM